MKKLPSDYPEHIDPRTGRFKKGFSGNPAGNQKGMVYKSARIKHALLSFFEDNYLNTGAFMLWARATGNEKAFFDYVIKHILPKDVSMSVETQSDLAQAIKEARSRKSPSK